MLDKWCPAPRTLPEEVQAQRLSALAGEGPMPEAYQHAHYIWYVFLGIATISGIALIVYGRVTAAIDAKKAAAE